MSGHLMFSTIEDREKEKGKDNHEEEALGCVADAGQRGTEAAWSRGLGSNKFTSPVITLYQVQQYLLIQTSFNSMFQRRLTAYFPRVDARRFQATFMAYVAMKQMLITGKADGFLRTKSRID
jgi:hypothetical protein